MKIQSTVSHLLLAPAQAAARNTTLGERAKDAPSKQAALVRFLCHRRFGRSLDGRFGRYLGDHGSLDGRLGRHLARSPCRLRRYGRNLGW
jgi:hypothetical protein